MKDHADFSADSTGVIGVSADKRFVFVRSCWDTGPRPECIYRIDLSCVADFWGSSMLGDPLSARPGFVRCLGISEVNESLKREA